MSTIERDVIDAIRGVLHVHSEYNADPDMKEIHFIEMILSRWEEYGVEEALGHGYAILNLARREKGKLCQS